MEKNLYESRHPPTIMNKQTKPRKPGLSKSKIISHLQCEKKLWLSNNRPDLRELDASSLARMEQGSRVGEIAWNLFPDGSLVDTSDIPKALVSTQALLLEKPAAIYEAALAYDGILVFVDMLVPDGDGYHLVEIKSSAQVKDYHYQDAAIQTWVAQQAGIKVTKTSVGCIDNQFVYLGGEDYNGLLYLTDVSEEISRYTPQVESWVTSARQTLSNIEPNIPMGKQCMKPFECDLQAYCQSLIPDRPDYPLSDLKLKKAQLQELEEKGYTDLLKVPSALIDDPNKQVLHEAVVSGRPYVSDEAQSEVAAIPYPRYYLDFETIGPAIPIWIGSRPYVQMPFQWSCHIEQADGSIEHHEFLGDPNEDPRETCAAALAELFKAFDAGSMVAYNASFEKGVFRQLAERYPQYETLFTQVCDQTYDLLPICRKYFYHRDMHGSWSIKYVLPAIAPALSYQALDVTNGGMAQDAYMRLINSNKLAEEVENIRSALLEYCKLDTLAMIKIAKYFEEEHYK